MQQPGTGEIELRPGGVDLQQAAARPQGGKLRLVYRPASRHASRRAARVRRDPPAVALRSTRFSHELLLQPRYYPGRCQPVLLAGVQVRLEEPQLLVGVARNGRAQIGRAGVTKPFGGGDGGAQLAAEIGHALD